MIIFKITLKECGNVLGSSLKNSPSLTFGKQRNIRLIVRINRKHNVNNNTGINKIVTNPNGKQYL